jgi:hemerythrin
MELIIWEERYNTGIDLFDKQHKNLVKMLNDLFKAVSQGKSKTITVNIIHGLIRYTHDHFADEEKEMLADKYKGYKAHKKEHEKLLRQVEKYRKRLAKGEEFGEELFIFLKNWLLDHILVTDKKYGSFFETKKI